MLRSKLGHWLGDRRVRGPDRLIVTNRHVASLVAKRAVDGRGIFMRDPFQAKFRAYIDFKEKDGSGPGQASSFEVLDSGTRCRADADHTAVGPSARRQGGGRR
jgi:hypothetical protein